MRGRAHLVLRLSAIVWRLSIRWVLEPMNWPTSSTKKLSRKPVGLLVEPRLDLVGEVLDRDRVGRAGTA